MLVWPVVTPDGDPRGRTLHGSGGSSVRDQSSPPHRDEAWQAHRCGRAVDGLGEVTGYEEVARALLTV